MASAREDITNMTNGTYGQQFKYHGSYSACLPIYTLLIVIDLWILFSLIHYGIKTKKWRRNHSALTRTLSSGVVYTSVIVCACLCFCYHLLVAINRRNGYNKNEGELCDLMIDLIRSVYGLIVFNVNVFLWLRQRVFYTNRVYHKIFGKISKALSFSIIFIILVGGVSGLILSGLPKDNVSSPIGCVYKPKGHLRNSSLLVTSLIIVFGQSALVCLLVHALLTVKRSSMKEIFSHIKCCKIMKSTVVEDVAVAKRKISETRINDKTKTIILKIIRKTVVFAFLSLTSDTIIITITLRLNKPNKRNDFSTILASMAVLFNLLFLILSFVSWKDIITSPCTVFNNLSCLKSERNLNETNPKDKKINIEREIEINVINV